MAPVGQVTPIHWGWNVVHDGWEFRSVKERGLCTQHVSSTSLAVHSMHTVRRSMASYCTAVQRGLV